jgi:hypothetical protein
MSVSATKEKQTHCSSTHPDHKRQKLAQKFRNKKAYMAAAEPAAAASILRYLFFIGMGIHFFQHF